MRQDEGQQNGEEIDDEQHSLIVQPIIRPIEIGAEDRADAEREKYEHISQFPAHVIGIGEELIEIGRVEGNSGIFARLNDVGATQGVEEAHPRDDRRERAEEIRQHEKQEVGKFQPPFQEEHDRRRREKDRLQFEGKRHAVQRHGKPAPAAQQEIETHDAETRINAVALRPDRAV